MSRRAGRFDAALSAQPKTVLVTQVLAALAAIAVVASLAGLLTLAPLALASSLVVAVAASWLSSAGFARIAGVRQHTPSALITGMLIFFLLLPSTDLLQLALVAATAVVASASEFVLVLRGRHVLNPAAFAVFAVGLTGLTGSAWWVATPVLAPFVLLGGLLVVLRMRLPGQAGVLLVVSVAVVTAGSLRFGTDLASAVSSALLSTPALFLAAFMFTEPFTLPNRRWQRYAEAALVGAITGLPYLVNLTGALRPTPELALLIGNLLAFAVARPVGVDATVAGVRRLTPTSAEVTLAPARPVPFTAGQYLELQLPHRGADRRGTRRTFSIVSAPGDAQLRIAMRVRADGSSFKATLLQSGAGTPVRVTTTGGGFVLPDDRSVPLVLVAGGIGVTPFISQLADDAARVAAGATPRDLLLVVQSADPDDLPYRDAIESFGVRVLLAAPDPIAGRPEPRRPDHWHRVARLDEDGLRRVLPAPESRTAYVSGSPRFVAETRRTLRALGIRRIRTDTFAGY